MNGTMDSYYDTIDLDDTEYECIVFEYEQDKTAFGEPQRSQLAYDLTTGILVMGFTTYSFGTPYILRFHLDSVTNPRVYLIVGSGIAVGFAVGLAAVYIRIGRRRL
jgi:hypothetical protein